MSGPRTSANSRAPSDKTRDLALAIVFVSTCTIAIGYAAAFNRGGTPPWAAWCLALGIPAVIGGIIALGATRGRSGLGKLKAPIAFVVFVLVVGFCAALALTPETALSQLWLGLPARAAIVIYGIGLVPIVVLPVAYALTFETQTLSAADLERVRAIARERVSTRVPSTSVVEPHDADA